MSKSKEIALITGASKGIGKAIALRMAQDGFKIWLNYRSSTDEAKEVQEEILSTGGDCELLNFDVANTQACKECLEPKLKTEVPYVLVNNAGFARDNLFCFMPEKDWADVLKVHLDGFFNITGCVLPSMLRKRKGRIINISSTSGQTGVGGQVNYSTAKAGLIGATRSLAVEVAKRNILVNAIAPGFIDTAMLDALPLEEIVKQIPMQRLGLTEEIAGVASFLASPDASYITGQVLAVNGGIFTG